MLTAAGTVRDRVDGLGLGADDYLPKPFDFAELVARVRALGRRSAPAVPPVLENGDITLDPGRRIASRAGRRLDLSPKEFAVLECLLAAAGRVVSAEELLERVWDEAADPFTTAVKTTMHRLRAKLGDPPVIHTVREGGYRIGEPWCCHCGCGSRCCTPPAVLHLRRPAARAPRSLLGSPSSRCTSAEPRRQPAGPGRPGGRTDLLEVLATRRSPSIGAGRGLARARLADRRPAPAAAARDHRHRPGHLRQQPAPAPEPRPARTTSSASSARPSTTCSPGWRHRSSRSGTSSPTPPTSCAPR